MALLFILTLVSGSFLTEKTISVDSGGHLFEYPQCSEVQSDGSFVVVNDHKVFHFSQDGALIRKMGAKGNGPGEFVMAYEAFWNGITYMVIDNRRRDLSFFTPSGDFIKREPILARHFYFLGKRTLMVDSALIFEKKPAICPIRISDELVIEPDGVPFHAVIPGIEQLGYNFSNIHATLHDGHLYVMDELSAEITRYNLDFKKESTIAPQIQGFVTPPTSWPTDVSNHKRRLLINTFSRIQRLGSIDAGLVIGYCLPDPEDPNDQFKNVIVVDSKGKPLSKVPLRINGDFIGTYQNRIYVLRETEDIRYEIDVIKLTGN